MWARPALTAALNAAKVTLKRWIEVERRRETEEGSARSSRFEQAKHPPLLCVPSPNATRNTAYRLCGKGTASKDANDVGAIDIGAIDAYTGDVGLNAWRFLGRAE